MYDAHDARREAQLAHESVRLEAFVDAATGSTSAERRQALNERITSRLAEVGLAGFHPLHAAPRPAVAT